jgi:hypothetical protein
MKLNKIILNAGAIAITALAFLAFKPAKFTLGTLFTDTSGKLQQVDCVRSSQGQGICSASVTYYTQNGGRFGTSAFATVE